MSFFEELRRRNVFRAGIAYVVVAWLLLQVADVVLPNIQAPEWIFQVILLLLVLGFPLTLLLAWAFELTAEGLQRETEVDRSRPVARPAGRRLDFAIIALLAIALGYFAFDKFVLGPQREAALIDSARQAAINQQTGSVAAQADKSIAVLPFVNRSENPGREHFADGLSEELVNLLARTAGLRVIARTSSFSYKGKDATIADISRELNVNHVLEGSVEESGDKLEVTASLIRAADSSFLWSDSFQVVKLDDIFGVRDQIAVAVVAQLKVKLLGAASTTPEINPAAYALFLQARELSRQSTEEGHEGSIRKYNQALKIVPDYAAALAGLAENYIFLAERVLLESIAEAFKDTQARCAADATLTIDQGNEPSIDNAFEEARCAANKALEIDATNAPAHASLGRIAMVHDHDLAVAASYLGRALELDPTDPRIITQAATLSKNLGRLDQAIRLHEYAVARDPVISAGHANLALSYFAAGRHDEAVAAFDTALGLSPDAVGLHSWMGEALLGSNRPAEALQAIAEEKDDVWRQIGLAIAYHALGQAAESDAALDVLTGDDGEEWAFNIAYVFAFRGEADRAFEWLDLAKKHNDPGLSEIVSTPEFDPIKSDPRWPDFLESIGKAPSQLDAVDFEVTLPE